MRNYPKLKVAAVQASPVYMDMDATVVKACKLIKEAADKGAKIVGFPEAFLPGFPYWCYLDDPITLMPYTQLLFANAITCPGNELSQIAQCAKENNIYVVIGATERDGGSVYDTQFVIDDFGNIIGKHRKLKPMNSEKMIWGEGDASTMEVYDTPYGRLGSLMSCDHMNPMASMVMNAQKEEIHVASFPALSESPSWYRSYDVNWTLANCYSISNACFVIFSTSIVTQEMIDILCKDHPEYEKLLPIGGGKACVLSPNGLVISDTLPENEEGVVTADIDIAAIGIENFERDTTGHYCNPSVRLIVDRTPRKVVWFEGAEPDNYVPYDALKKYLEGGSVK